MSRIFKKNDINVDTENKVYIKHKNLNGILGIEDEPEIEEKIETEDTDVTHSAEEIISRAKHEASMIIDEANEIADKIIKNATEEQTHIYDESKNRGYDDGYKDGYDEGHNSGMESVEEIQNELNQQIEEVQKQQSTLLYDTEKDMVDLVYDIVKNITYGAFELKEDLLAVLVKRGIANATIQNKVSIKVSPDDYDNVIKHKEDFTKLIDSSKEIEILKDFSLLKNDCLIETEFGNIDCGLTEQLESVKNSLYFILNDR